MYRVMIVDDEPYVIEGLKTLIDWEKYGFKVCFEADNGTTALELAENFNPELIITDIRMPEINGLELIEKCQKQLKHKPQYIILSGFNDFEYARTAMRFGVSNYILKPIDEEELGEALNKVKRELDRIKEDFHVDTDYNPVVNELLMKYITGEGDEHNLIKGYIQNYKEAELSYMIVQWENYEKPFRRFQGELCIADRAIRKIILNTIGDNMSINVIEDNRGYGILVTEKIMDKFDNNLNNLAQKIISNIQDGISLNVNIYLGKAVKGLTRIKESRDTCMNTININFLLSRKGIVKYQEIMDMTINYNVWNNKLFDILMEAVEKNNVEKIYESLEIIFEEIKNELPAPEIVKANIASFELEVIKLVLNMNGNANELSKCIKNFKFISGALDEIKEELKNFCIFASEYINTLKEIRNIGLVGQVRKYIDLNYNKNIKLKNISEVFYINPIYLGQIFKKKIGTSFKDYLNEIRIHKAEELLKDNDLKVCEISSMVGFNDPNYFISKFEKTTNLSPTEYKKFCKNNG